MPQSDDVVVFRRRRFAERFLDEKHGPQGAAHDVGRAGIQGVPAALGTEGAAAVGEAVGAPVELEVGAWTLGRGLDVGGVVQRRTSPPIPVEMLAQASPRQCDGFGEVLADPTVVRRVSLRVHFGLEGFGRGPLLHGLCRLDHGRSAGGQIGAGGSARRQSDACREYEPGGEARGSAQARRGSSHRSTSPRGGSRGGEREIGESAGRPARTPYLGEFGQGSPAGSCFWANATYEPTAAHETVASPTVPRSRPTLDV
jgi:hypothetical protein